MACNLRILTVLLAGLWVFGPRGGRVAYAQDANLIEFSDAEYPPEALAERRVGQVVLRLEIDPEGNVTAATVTEPIGHGFDEAARLAALQFRFSPAKRGDTPVAARLLYTYDFRLPEPEVEVASVVPTARHPATWWRQLGCAGVVLASVPLAATRHSAAGLFGSGPRIPTVVAVELAFVALSCVLFALALALRRVQLRRRSEARASDASPNAEYDRATDGSDSGPTERLAAGVVHD